VEIFKKKISKVKKRDNTSKMKYFEKIAVGPVINITKDPTKNLGGIYMKASTIKNLDTSEDIGSIMSKMTLNKKFSEKQQQIAKKKGAIIGNIGKSTLPWTSKSDVKRHELVHHIRSEKGKWSSENYSKSRIARFVEETAAHRRGGENIGRSIQGGLAAAVGKRSKIFSILTKIK
jgi:hypothetical protein